MLHAAARDRGFLALTASLSLALALTGRATRQARTLGRRRRRPARAAAAGRRRRGRRRQAAHGFHATGWDIPRTVDQRSRVTSFGPSIHQVRGGAPVGSAV